MMRKKRKNKDIKENRMGLNNLLFTLGLSSLFIIVGIIYQFLLKQTENMSKEQILNKKEIAQLKIDKDMLTEQYEYLCSNENILKLAKKYYGNTVKQASPKGVIYIGEND